LREKFGFRDKFVVACTGVHGLAQGLDSLLRSAELLREHKGIRFRLFGDGPEKRSLQSVAAQRGLTNVEFHAPIPASQMAAVLASIDVSIVPLKRSELFKGALPSKLFEALGAGVPVIAALDGEAKELVQRSQGGLVVEPENPEDMAHKILLLYGDSELRKRLGENGRRFVHTYYNREEIAKTFEQLIDALCAPRSSAITSALAEKS
jgi:glycosyltransferase involved in cell wall biosynthesis